MPSVKGLLSNMQIARLVLFEVNEKCASTIHPLLLRNVGGSTKKVRGASDTEKGCVGAAVHVQKSNQIFTMRASSKPLSPNKHLIRWVEKMAELCMPESIHWVDGSEEENTKLCAQLVKTGTFVKLNEESWPGC